MNIYWPPTFRMYRFVSPYGGYVLCRSRVDDLDDPGAPSRHMLLKCCWLTSPTVGKWSMNVGYSSINPLDFLAFYSKPNLSILPRHHCNIPRILQARFDRTKRPNKVGKSPGGSSKISHQSIEIFHGSSRTLMCENPLCGPYLAWQAVVKSWGLTSSSGQVLWGKYGKYMEIYGNMMIIPLGLGMLRLFPSWTNPSWVKMMDFFANRWRYGKNQQFIHEQIGEYENFLHCWCLETLWSPRMAGPNRELAVELLLPMMQAGWYKRFVDVCFISDPRKDPICFLSRSSWN